MGAKNFPFEELGEVGMLRRFYYSVLALLKLLDTLVSSTRSSSIKATVAVTYVNELITCRFSDLTSFKLSVSLCHPLLFVLLELIIKNAPGLNVEV